MKYCQHKNAYYGITSNHKFVRVGVEEYLRAEEQQKEEGLTPYLDPNYWGFIQTLSAPTVTFVDALPPAFFLTDPFADRGNGIRALGKRHARLFLHINIWQRSQDWFHLLEDRQLLKWYALHLFIRTIRRYHVSAPLPEEGNLIDPCWLKDKPMDGETENQMLARYLYIVAFSDELSFGGYIAQFLNDHTVRWNRRCGENQ